MDIWEGCNIQVEAKVPLTTYSALRLSNSDVRLQATSSVINIVVVSKVFLGGMIGGEKVSIVINLF